MPTRIEDGITLDQIPEGKLFTGGIVDPTDSYVWKGIFKRMRWGVAKLDGIDYWQLKDFGHFRVKDYQEVDSFLVT